MVSLDAEIVLKQTTQVFSLLVIDSSSYIFMEYGKYLDEMFENVYFVQSEEAAIKILRTNSVDIVFVDIGVQHSNPFEIINSLELISTNLKIVSISENKDPEFLIRIIRTSVIDFLHKPFRLIDLKNLLIRVVNKIFDSSSQYSANDLTETSSCLTPVGAINYLMENFYTTVDIVNHYKGVPIFRSATLIDLTEYGLSVRIDNGGGGAQSKVAEISGHSIITSKYLSKDIYATIKEVNHDKQIVILDKMNFIESYIHHRKSVRIAPDNSFNLVIEAANIKYSFKVINISMHYALVSLAKLPNTISINTKLKLFITFKVKAETNFKTYNIKTTGHIHDIFHFKNNIKMLIFFELDSVDKHHFENYIYRRGLEIVNELKVLINRKNKIENS